MYMYIMYTLYTTHMHTIYTYIHTYIHKLYQRHTYYTHIHIYTTHTTHTRPDLDSRYCSPMDSTPRGERDCVLRVGRFTLKVVRSWRWS